MAYLQFNKHELGNLEYSLSRELLATNRAGGYTNTTIVGCNTRKYHGLLIVPIEAFGGEKYVLLSGLDETLVQHGQSFHLGIHRYPGVYEPRGHKYIVDFELEKVMTLTYRVGGVMLRKEIMLLHNRDQFLVRYTLLRAHSSTILKIKPFLAFRPAHSLTCANINANIFHGETEKGICCKLYEGFPTLYMQLDVPNEFVSCPDWYKNVEYPGEKARGYAYREDLFVPGYFECPIRQGQSVIFSASLQNEDPSLLKAVFDHDLMVRKGRKSYLDCLVLSADQFLCRKGEETTVVAGYPWFGPLTRDTFIALPGLTLAANYDLQACRSVMDTMLPVLYKDGTADVRLWFFWTLQQYYREVPDARALWSKYGKAMKDFLRAYKAGMPSGVAMHANGLIWARSPQGLPLSWMDTCIDGEAVTPREGYQVEVNALWYNAVCFALELLGKVRQSRDDEEFAAEFVSLPPLIRENFYSTFWSDKCMHLADFVSEQGQNIFNRPNQLMACALPYSPLTEEVQGKVLKACTGELLTIRGIRTLSPKNPLYIGLYEGDPQQRDRAYHQGTVRPWLLMPYMDAMFKLYGKAFVRKAKELAWAFEEDITVHGIGSIAELYDGNPPYNSHGCTSQACSVAAVLRSLALINAYEKKNKA